MLRSPCRRVRRQCGNSDGANENATNRPLVGHSNHGLLRGLDLRSALPRARRRSSVLVPVPFMRGVPMRVVDVVEMAFVFDCLVAASFAVLMPMVLVNDVQ